jgi:hypothetical protein
MAGPTGERRMMNRYDYGTVEGVALHPSQGGLQELDLSTIKDRIPAIFIRDHAGVLKYIAV